MKKEQDERKKVASTEQSISQTEDQATKTSTPESTTAEPASRPAEDIGSQAEEKRKRKREYHPNDKAQWRKVKQKHTTVENHAAGGLVYQPSYNRANISVQTLNEIRYNSSVSRSSLLPYGPFLQRRAWDCCQVEEAQEGSSVPQDILQPVPPSSNEWARVFIVPGFTSDGLHKMKERDPKRTKRQQSRHGAKFGFKK